jgi:dGTPase
MAMVPLMTQNAVKIPPVDAPAYNYCALPLALYASRPDQSRGRLHDEPESKYRTPFQRDRDRIIHSTAFRRLKSKTQVFVYHEGDHYRTRLSHTIEVAQIARTLARALLVNEDLAEAGALAHDLGHTPFAHMGEEALQKCMDHLGGFDHNDQSLRILTTLERKYPKWDGLNLTWETLEAVAKHNGPKLRKNQKPNRSVLPASLYELSQNVDLKLDQQASVEAQIAALADDIAYNNHDVEDGIRAGFFSLDELCEMPLLRDTVSDIRKTYPDIADDVLIAEMIRDMIGRMVQDVLTETRARLEVLNPQSADDVRAAAKPVVAFSDPMKKMVDELRSFLFARMYRHYTLERIWIKVEKIIPDLFNAFMRKHTILPDHWQRRVEAAGGLTNDQARARIICDYIAGMTDRYAIREHEKIFDLYWDLK